MFVIKPILLIILKMSFLASWCAVRTSSKIKYKFFRCVPYVALYTSTYKTEGGTLCHA